MTDKDLERQAEELAAYLDAFMTKGGGHVNVTAGGDTLLAKEYRSNDCTRKDAPCRLPNIGGEQEDEI